jgi:hypothetical protein
MRFETFEDVAEEGYEIIPIPGGCLVTSGPRRRRYL